MNTGRYYYVLFYNKASFLLISGKIFYYSGLGLLLPRNKSPKDGSVIPQLSFISTDEYLY